jgi:hypothetical protein
MIRIVFVIPEPRITFVIPMKSQKVNERESATLECDLNDKDGDVEWFHDGVKIKPDNKRYREERVNRKRRLIMDVCMLEDQVNK